MTKLRKSAREAPYCFGCGLHNPNSDLLCLAHSNALEHGRGIGHKSRDEEGAILCDKCHKWYDFGPAPREEKRAAFAEWHRKTAKWWKEKGYL